jgi:hypothetical protein
MFNGLRENSSEEWRDESIQLMDCDSIGREGQGYAAGNGRECDKWKLV